jgi:hypothetical protein
MTKFRVFVFSPAFNVIRRMTVEADDEFAVVDVVMFQLSETQREDPDAHLDIKEIE